LRPLSHVLALIPKII